MGFRAGHREPVSMATEELSLGRLYGGGKEERRDTPQEEVPAPRQLIGQHQTRDIFVQDDRPMPVRLVSGKAGGDCIDTISTRMNP